MASYDNIIFNFDYDKHNNSKKEKQYNKEENSDFYNNTEIKDDSDTNYINKKIPILEQPFFEKIITFY